MADRPTDYDSPWKEALERYLPECLALLTPWLYDAIDWTHAPVFLDKELQAIAPNSVNNRRYADKLVRLRTKTQRVFWLLLHIEIQVGRITLRSFGPRMYLYYTRIGDHHRASQSGTNPTGVPVEVISLAVLTHSRATTTHITYDQTDPLGATHVQFRFPVVHLKNWLDHWEELERLAATNPFAVIVMAQLQAQQTRMHDPKRLASKHRIMRLLYHHDYSRQDVL